MLSTGGATPDSGEKCVSMAISHFHSPLPPSRRMTFVGGTAIPSPFAPHSGSQGQTEAALLKRSMTEKKWLLLCQRHRNSGIGRMRISSLCPSALGPQKWVWASARKMRLAASGKPNALLALPRQPDGKHGTVVKVSRLRVKVRTCASRLSIL